MTRGCSLLLSTAGALIEPWRIVFWVCGLRSMTAIGKQALNWRYQPESLIQLVCEFYRMFKVWN
jgi:hypothetical protein